MTTALEIPAYRLFDVRVVRSGWISPTFVRVTLGGTSLRHFAPWGLDQRVKLLLPPGGAGSGTAWHGPFAADVDGLSVAEWRTASAALPAEERPHARTYTPRSVRPEIGEVDLDFFVHEPAGPASEWAIAAVPGDRLLVSGPDVRADDRSHGIQWRPDRPPRTVLLLGDETAVPALNGIVASLAPDAHGTLVVEADDPASCPPIERVPAGVRVQVLARGSARPGEVLVASVSRWVRTEADAARAAGDRFAAWMAAESSAVPTLRGAVVGAGLPRDRVQGQGYWIAGKRKDEAKVG